MQPDQRAYLHDIAEAVEAISRFVRDRTFADYASDQMLRYAVERAFIVIGEALNLLSRAYPETAGRVWHLERIISFRNILVHGYAVVDDRVVWDTVQTHLPALRRDVVALLRELNDRDRDE